MILPAIIVGSFEMIRHRLFHMIPVGWGNLMVAGVASLASLLYYNGIFTLIQSLHKTLQEEKEETATLKERDRISRELHDSVSQALFFLNIKASEIEKAVEQQKQPFEEIREFREAIKITDTDVRQHIYNLQIASQANVDFVTTIENYLTHFQEQSGIKFDVVMKGKFNKKLNNRVKSQLIRIFQELLWNIRKHSGAQTLRVELLEKNNRFHMVVKDDGKGFDLNQLEQRKSFGLQIVKERTQAINAQYDIESNLGTGTKVTIQLDLD